ncbi:MAG: hypothetical protein M1840_004594 [Geoglossum simile]|nr:MAG: hypothetical protein M1840_004594 [Geoglossum simile]
MISTAPQYGTASPDGFGTVDQPHRAPSSPPKVSSGSRSRSYTKGRHNLRPLSLATEGALDTPTGSKTIEGHPEVKVRDFAYATPSNKENTTTNWARFSIDAAVAIVDALKEAKQMGQLTTELEVLLQVGELAVVNLPKLLTLHKSELKLELGQAFLSHPDGNPLLRVQLTSLLMATHAVGGGGPESSSTGAIESPRSSAPSTSASGTRHSCHRRSPAGPGHQPLFPGSPSPKVIVAPTQGPAPASHGELEGEMFQSANRKLHFAQGEDGVKRIALAVASDSYVKEDLAASDGGSTTTAGLDERSGEMTHVDSEKNSVPPAAEAGQSAPTKEETARALSKRASLQAQTGALSAPIEREYQEAHIARQQTPPNSDPKKPLTARFQAVSANQGIAPTIEELEHAMARSVILAKQKGIPPPDWEQLRMREDYFLRRDLGAATGPELHRLTRIQEEDGTNLEGVPNPKGGAISTPDGQAIPAQVGEDPTPPAGCEVERQKVPTQAAVGFEAENALGYIPKQEPSTLADIDLFSGLDTWLAARELAASANPKTGELNGKDAPAEEAGFGGIALGNGGPANIQEYVATDAHGGSPDLGKLSVNGPVNRPGSGEADRSNLAGTKHGNLAASGVGKSAEASTGPVLPTRTLEGFEPLFP